MKKFVVIFSMLTVVAVIFSSCGKQCNCTRFEDGVKVATYTDDEVVYYEKSICTDQSVSAYQGKSIVTDGKDVTIEIKCK